MGKQEDMYKETVPFTYINVIDECKNLEWSYGMICVKCNKCGRFNDVRWGK